MWTNIDSDTSLLLHARNRYTSISLHACNSQQKSMCMPAEREMFWVQFWKKETYDSDEGKKGEKSF